ncbi:fatty-acid amide hydrolase 2-like [Polistes fuscatus]|uniref:fatty-acid amide hydrolase 2-like n=1 Tax=Polistes fuscatus TaxID=30207 RepID=UPI001CAA34A5|nr:fatty-acid amide hydrolase 2-like [Polistes fuscatus]
MCTTKIYSSKKHVEPSLMNAIKHFILNLITCVFIQFHSIFDYIITIIFDFYYEKKVTKVPPVKNPLLLESATKLAEKIRTKEVKAEEVVQSFIDRCKEVDKIIHAIVEDRFKEAIEDAKQVDFELESYKDTDDLKETKPFLGVPFTTKESNEAEGLLHTMGMVSRKNHRSQSDATVVSYMKKAGGILIAKTNIPELNLWVESRNNVYGQTCNPYNTTRTVGGSSGGEAAIIAACGSAISIGSDIGGSTRMPSFYNGVFGMKPSEGVTSLKGIGLRTEYYPESMAAAGPICKLAEDLTPMLKVLVGDKISMLKLDEPVDVTNLRIFYQKSSGDIRTSKVCSSMRSAFKRTIEYFEEITKTPATKIKIPGSEYSFKLWRYWMTQEKADFKRDITNGKYRADAVEEIKKFILYKSDITFAALLKLIDEDLLPKENAEWAKNLTSEMKQYLLNVLGNNGVLLYPSAPFPAVHHYSSFLRPYNFTYWALFNVLKFPVCQVPLGLDYDGLPLGIQVIAAPYRDHLCIAVAKELETAFGGWVQPPH